MKRIIVLVIVLAIGIAAAVLYTMFPPEPVQVSAVIGEDGELTLSTSAPEAEQTEPVTGSDIVFSHEATFYSENIEVALTAAEGAEIYYTTDGSEPKIEPSYRYMEPITVNAGPEVRVTTVRAMSVVDGTAGKIHTRSFVSGTEVNERFSDDTLVFVLSTDPYNLYDYEYGIAVPGKIYDDYVKEHPGEEIPYNAPGNYYMSGREAERDMYVEVFESDGDNVISQDAGARVVGGYSRVVDQKSFKLIARKEYDPENGKFKYAFFDGALTEDGVPISEYDRIVLRNGANDREFAGVRDELSQQLARDYGFAATQHTTPCAVFLNGEYYGYSWLHENYNEDYLATQFGGNRDQYGIIENIEVPEPEEGEIIEQPLKDYLAMTEYFDKDLTDDKIFEEFCQLVDVENLLQYYCMQIYISNKDWPGNNFKAYRYYPAEGEEITSEHMDGRWRFLFFDAEYGWGLYGEGHRLKTMSDLLTGRHMSGESKALQALFKRDDMRKLLANIMSDLTAYAFSAEHANEVLDDLIEISDPEQMYALDLGIVSTWAHRETFADSRKQIRDFANRRYEVVLKEMIDLLGLTFDFYDVSASGAVGADITLSTQHTQRGTLYATYFADCDVQLSADIHEGYKFVKWVINDVEYDTPSVTITSDMAVDRNVFAKLYTEKLELTDAPVRIREVCTDKNAGWIKLYNPNSQDIVISGMYMSDDVTTPTEWSMPATEIPALSDVVIVMKNNKSKDALMKLQASFSLKEGETLTLCDIDGNIVDSVYVPYIGEGKTYVLQTDGKYKVK